MRVWHALLEHGVYTNPVVFPAAAKGRALLRISCMATQTPEQIDYALEQFQSRRQGPRAHLAPARVETTGRIRVEPVSGRGVEAFIAAPRRLYEGNPHWVPPLALMERAELDPKRNHLPATGRGGALPCLPGGRPDGRAHLRADRPRTQRPPCGKDGLLRLLRMRERPRGRRRAPRRGRVVAGGTRDGAHPWADELLHQRHRRPAGRRLRLAAPRHDALHPSLLTSTCSKERASARPRTFTLGASTGRGRLHGPPAASSGCALAPT